MYCTECGKQNPDEARFCAFCGVKLLAAEGVEEGATEPENDDKIDEKEITAAQEPKALVPEPDENGDEADDPSVEKPVAPESAQGKTPAKAARQGGAKTKPAEAAYARGVQSAAAKSARRKPVDPSRTVVPIVENPAQPLRPGEKNATWKPTSPVVPPEAEAPESADEEKPRRKVTHRPPNPNTAVTASGEEEPLPARRAPVKKSYKRVGEAPSTLVPDRVRQKKIDLFFDGSEDDEEDDDYDDYEEYDESDGKVRRRVVSVVVSVLVLAAFAAVFWLLATTPGQVFRASMGLSAPASAYKLHGDQLREGGNVLEAAAAYHDALKLDPDNFQYAILTGQTQEIIGENEMAEKAYGTAIQIDSTKAEAYRLLALLYERQGNADRQRSTLEAGYAATGSEELKALLDGMAAGDGGEG